MRIQGNSYLLLVGALSFGLIFPTHVFAQLERVGGLAGINGAQSEFKNSNRQNRLLIEVNMLSGVMQKGIHQVPDTTNLIDMVALAGGPEDQADISEVLVKRKSKAGFETHHFDLGDLVESKSASLPVLQDGDVVMIQRSSSETLYRTLSFVGIGLGILVSGFVIRNELQRK